MKSIDKITNTYSIDEIIANIVEYYTVQEISDNIYRYIISSGLGHITITTTRQILNEITS